MLSMRIFGCPLGFWDFVLTNSNLTDVAHLVIVEEPLNRGNYIHRVSNSRSYLNNIKLLITWTNLLFIQKD